VDASVNHPTPALSKRKAAAAAKAAKKETVYTGPKTPEMEALEEKIAKKGDEVRNLKAQTEKTKELAESTAAAVEELKKLKSDLAEVIKNLQ